MERIVKILFQPPCYRQELLTLDQVAHSLIQVLNTSRKEAFTISLGKKDKLKNRVTIS